jgi:hypothetical protein
MSDIVHGSIDGLIDERKDVASGSDDHAGLVALVMLTAIVLLVCAVVVFGYAAVILYALAATAVSFVTLVILTAGR